MVLAILLIAAAAFAVVYLMAVMAQQAAAALPPDAGAVVSTDPAASGDNDPSQFWWPVSISPEQGAALAAINASGTEFDAALVMGLIDRETGGTFNPASYNGNDPGGGAFGLMQVLLTTARDMGYSGAAEGLFDPATNVAVGTRYLSWIRAYLARHFGGVSVEQILAGYNAGVGNVVNGYLDLGYVSDVKARAAKWAGVLARGAYS